MSEDVKLNPGWLARDVGRAALVVATDEVIHLERRVRNLNDELSDANTALKVARMKLNDIKRNAQE